MAVKKTFGPGKAKKQKVTGKKIAIPRTKAPKMGAGSADLKATQKEFGFTSAAKKGKMLKAEKKMKNNVKYEMPNV